MYRKFQCHQALRDSQKFVFFILVFNVLEKKQFFSNVVKKLKSYLKQIQLNYVYLCQRDHCEHIGMLQMRFSVAHRFHF